MAQGPEPTREDWEAEARRLAAATDGDAESIHDGLLSFSRRHAAYADGELTPERLRLLANRAAARHLAARYCAVGYRGHYHWLDTLQDEVADMPDPVPDPEEVGEIFLAAWDAQVAAQRSWPEETDNDRLTRAFAALNGDAVVAREDFTCCQRCAGAEIFDEIPVGSEPLGFVFFHRQDTLRAVAHGALLLGFGGFVPRAEPSSFGPRVAHAPAGDAVHVAVAERAVAALQAEGLHTAWDGSAGQRITVHLDWKRRIEAH